MSRARRVVFTAVVSAVIAVTATVLAVPASAHVTVSAPGATAGGSDQLITFRVPNESSSAVTTELQIKFPTGTPIASVLPQHLPGWTISTTTARLATPIHTDDGDITEAVSTVTWKAAAGSGIPVGQFEQFVVLAGQLPDATSLTFPAVQTYSDGSVVSWIEVAAPGSSAEPEHPAPVLRLGNATGPAAATASGGRTASGKSSSTGAVVLAVIALVVAAAGVGYTTVRTARRR